MSDNIRTDSIELLCTKDDFFELMDDNAKLCKRIEELEAALINIEACWMDGEDMRDIAQEALKGDSDE